MGYSADDLREDLKHAEACLRYAARLATMPEGENAVSARRAIRDELEFIHSNHALRGAATGWPLDRDEIEAAYPGAPDAADALARVALETNQVLSGPDSDWGLTRLGITAGILQVALDPPVEEADLLGDAMELAARRFARRQNLAVRVGPVVALIHETRNAVRQLGRTSGLVDPSTRDVEIARARAERRVELSRQRVADLTGSAWPAAEGLGDDVPRLRASLVAAADAVSHAFASGAWDDAGLAPVDAALSPLDMFVKKAVENRAFKPPGVQAAGLSAPPPEPTGPITFDERTHGVFIGGVAVGAIRVRDNDLTWEAFKRIVAANGNYVPRRDLGLVGKRSGRFEKQLGPQLSRVVGCHTGRGRGYFLQDPFINPDA